MAQAQSGPAATWPDRDATGNAEGLILLDERWRLTYVSPLAARQLCRNADDLVGRPVAAILDDSTESALRTACGAAEPDAVAIALTVPPMPPRPWLEMRGYRRSDGFGIGLRDVSVARQHHLQAVDERKNRVINQRLFETSLDLILVVDRKGNLIRVSPSSRTILGYDPGEMAGRPASDFLYPQDLPGTRAEMRQARQGHETRHFDCRYVHRDGRIVPLNWTGVWSEPEQQHFFVGRDMTDRLATEEQLRHAQRLEAVGKLTGGIAHDFNNLLTVVLGNMDLALESSDQTPELRELCEAALHAAERGAELTRRLLAFARQQPLEPKRVEVNDLVGNIMRLLKRTLGERIESRFFAGEGLWPVMIDAANLEAAIANLAVNARDAMTDGGRLTVETDRAILDHDYVRDNPDAVPGEYVVVIVTDTGHGMAPEVLHRIFEPFFTTKEAGKGTGLGLSMVFGFVRQSGGHIKVYSEVDVGTTFRLYLPRNSVDQDVPQAPQPPEPGPEPGRQECILVVEDNEGIRTVVLQQLARLGYRTLHAENGAAALALLERHPAIDLLFTDLVMPGGMGGHDLALAATALRPDLKVLYTSGFPGAALAGDTRIDAVLSKPYRTEDLARKIRHMLDR
ncbi:MAG: ATP-binding protein [Sneathiellaceae bacterium]